MTQTHKANLDTIFDRLVAKLEQQNRQLDVTLNQLALGSDEELEQVRDRLQGESARLQKIEAEFQVEIDRVNTDASWTQLCRPELHDLQRQFRGQMIRA